MESDGSRIEVKSGAETMQAVHPIWLLSLNEIGTKELASVKCNYTGDELDKIFGTEVDENGYAKGGRCMLLETEAMV